ncbi:MAG: hypothetical protein JWR60_3973, partial [Polaromonas sp.]|nr:hypothetical protein [Polaromonas sp.]
MKFPRHQLTLAERGAELNALGWEGAKVNFFNGREMRFTFTIAPTLMSRTYRCMLKVPRSGVPEMIVLEPDLKILACGRTIEHIYTYAGKGTKLCLWLPNAGEWDCNMKFIETYLPWTA